MRKSEKIDKHDVFVPHKNKEYSCDIISHSLHSILIYESATTIYLDKHWIIRNNRKWFESSTYVTSLHNFFRTDRIKKRTTDYFQFPNVIIRRNAHFFIKCSVLLWFHILIRRLISWTRSEIFFLGIDLLVLRCST